MKLYMMTDLEGVAGVYSFERQTSSGNEYYEEARRLLTAEVNACIEGAIAGGVTEVLVDDGHGAGAVHYESLHDAARVLQGHPRRPVWDRGEQYGSYDIACMVGQHAMSGTADGSLNHTQSAPSVDYYKLNGQYIGEIAQWSLCMGAYGVPVIFLSGDEAACREAERLVPGITTAAVKKGLTSGCAISLSRKRAHDLIRERMASALQAHRRAPVAPLVWPGPYRLEIRYKHTNLADNREAQGWERLDSQTVAIESEDVLRIIYA